MNLEVNLIKHHQQMEEIERPETSKCSRQQNQLNKTLTNFRQKQGMGGGGGAAATAASEQQQQMINITGGSQQQQQQYSIQKNQPLPPSIQQSRSGTRQGRGNNSFQTTGQGFFKETFYRENSINNNNNNSNINNSNNNNNNVNNTAPVMEEGMTLDKFFGSNFQVINLGFNTSVEEKPSKSMLSMMMGNSDQFQQNYNPKNSKIQSNFEESKQTRSNRASKDESLNGNENSKQRSKRSNKNQVQPSLLDDNSGEYKDYMEEEFEIHETDEEYSESNRESQADLNINDNMHNDDNTQKTNKSKRKSIEDRTRDKSQGNVSQQQDYSLTGKSIKQYLNTQDSGDEKQTNIQKKLRDKYSKKMRHKPFNTTSLQSHQANSIESSNQPSSTTSANSAKNSQQSQSNSQQPYLVQYQSGAYMSNHDNQQNNYQAYNSGKGKYSTNNTSQSYSTNYSTNFNSNVTNSGQNERGSLTFIEDQQNRGDFDSFNPKSSQINQNNNGSSSNIVNTNGNNNYQSVSKRQKSIHDNDSSSQYKSNTYYAANRKDWGGGSIKDTNLNNSYILQKQQHQTTFNHSLSLNQTDNNDLQPQNSSQIEKTTKNYNIRKINKSQSPPVRDPFQPLITHQRNFSRDTTHQQQNHLNNPNNSSSSSSMQNTINQANLPSNTNASTIKNNVSNIMNQMNQQGINNSQILNSQSGESFKQNGNNFNSIQQNNSHIKVINGGGNGNPQGMSTNPNITIQHLQRKSKYGEFLDSQSNNDKTPEIQKQFRTSFYQAKQQQQQQQQQQNQQQPIIHGVDIANFAQTSSSFANAAAAAAAANMQGIGNGQNPILAPLNSLPTNNSYYNATSKNRLTLNEFYKHQSKYEDYGQPSGPPNMNQYEEFIAENLMRRTAKENKFLNQKEKLNELIKKEDINFVTKYAARFNLNNDECQQLIQTGKQEKTQIKKRMETPHKGFRGDFSQNQQKKKISVPKEQKQLSSTSNNPTQISRPQNESNNNNNNQYQSKERNSVLF